MSALTQSMKQFYGPYDFMANTTHLNPLKIVFIDVAGPFYLNDGQEEHEKSQAHTNVFSLLLPFVLSISKYKRFFHKFLSENTKISKRK